ncbi:hypothetical protein [Deinococcus apachensis]|uniref:hypothetical protein n=1 Tax=Deinococcus apachensis TaxID=309886 RepID=UPI001FDFCA80|nr:hypothetical protein [Deinococcus apachensis]
MVEAVDPLVIDRLPLAFQQDVKPPIPKARTLLGEMTEPTDQGLDCSFFGLWCRCVERQMPNTWQARRSLNPKRSRTWLTRRLLSGIWA